MIGKLNALEELKTHRFPGGSCPDEVILGPIRSSVADPLEQTSFQTSPPVIINIYQISHDCSRHIRYSMAFVISVIDYHERIFNQTAISLITVLPIHSLTRVSSTFCCCALPGN